MKVVLLLLLLIISTSGEGPGLISFLKDLMKGCPSASGYQCPKLMSFWLYTRTNWKGVELDSDALDKAPFVDGDLKIVIHGYQNNKDSVIFRVLRKAYFTRGDINIMAVDWGAYCKAACYVQAVSSISLVAKCVAAMVNLLHKERKFNNVHMLGHSLGAHVAAWASKDVHPQLQRLTRFDPALPLFIDTMTNPGVADFKDVYHSNIGVAGQILPEGTVDVYFNSGSFQPGCKCDISCSHMRSVKYYAESITRGMKGFRCKSWNKFMKLKCHPPLTKKNLVNLGENIDKSKRGRFMVFTRRKSPFLMPPKGYISKKKFYLFERTSASDCDVPDVTGLVKKWLA